MPGFECNLFIDLNEREKKVKEFLTCGICLNIFKDAVRSGGCEHTFCKECVQQWIDSKHSTCPECRTGFSSRKATPNTRNNENLVIIGSHIFDRNLIINNFVNELTTKCKFESNGCQELVKIGLVSAHNNECEHRICKACDFDLNISNHHNCVDVLKSQKIELKRENNLMKSEIENLETLLLEKTDKVKRIDQQIEEFQSSNHLIDSSKQIKSQLTDYILFGSFKFNIKILQISTHLIKLEIRKKFTGTDKVYIEYDLKIPFTYMQELMYCSDPTLTAIIIKPNIEGYHNLQHVIWPQPLGRTSTTLDLNSQDLNDSFIIIVFKETIKLFFEHFIRQQIEPNIKCESISVDTTKLFISRAQNKSITA